MNPLPSNAVAGPSTPHRSQSPTPQSPTVPPPLFLPPPAPPAGPAYLSSTQDLLARFRLLSAYDKYVRPFAAPNETGLDLVPPTPGGVDKGKGRERDQVTTSPAAQTPGVDGQDGDDDEGGGKGEKKKKNSYKHLIKGVPGKHSMKKDDYLSTMMQVPPKQRIPITPFDLKTQREAFTVSLEGLKGWNPNALVVESAQAREDRKKRKELKRLAKAQALSAFTPAPATPSAATPSSHQPHQPLAAPVPLPPSNSNFPPRANTNTPRPGTGTPRSSVPRPGSARPSLSVQPIPPGQRVSTPLRTGTPTSAHPLRTATPTSAHPLSATSAHPPSSSGLPGVGGAGDKRGKKRDREDLGGGVSAGGVVNGTGTGTGNAGVNGVVGVSVNGSGNGAGANAIPGAPKVVVGARAGVVGARPRPIKKQRMDIQGQARDVTAVQQQPTPQGV